MELIKTQDEEYYATIENGVEIKNGEYKKFYNDRLKIKCYYINNKLNGQYIVFNHNNTINKISNYNNDILEGEEIQYYDHYGTINIRKSIYNNGKLHGKSKLYNSDGKVEWSIIYDNGDIIRPYKKHHQCVIL